jgi:hypothetical protein
VLGTLIWPDQPDTTATVSRAATGDFLIDHLVFGASRWAVALLSQMLASLTTALDHGLPSVPAAWAERRAHEGEPGREYVCRIRRCR